jgi:cytosine/adenosine deaminase-related metal-dependent hydrolase
MHTHLAEDPDEDSYCDATYGMRPLAYAESCEWIGDDVWFAHGIRFDDAEIRLLGETRTGVCHCPTSNMKLGTGGCRVPALRAAGAPVGLGVDGSASNDTSNMLLEARMALLLQTLLHGPGAVSALDCLRIGTTGSAQLLGRDQTLGSLEVGKAADMFLLDTRQLGFAGALHDDSALPLLTGTGQTVATTIVQGRVVVSGGRLVNIDEERLARRAQAAASRLVSLGLARA